MFKLNQAGAENKVILLGIGSNIGDRCKYLNAAITGLEAVEQISVKQVSAFYETEPFGFKEQDWFLNAVVAIKTSLQPLELLDVCQQIEKKLNRRRDIHWGPRTIDIDILVYNGIKLETERLTLPHPYLALRRFVLIPAAEISSDIIAAGQTAQELLRNCPDECVVSIYNEERI